MKNDISTQKIHQHPLHLAGFLQSGKVLSFLCDGCFTRFVNEAKLSETKIVETSVKAALNPFIKYRRHFCKIIITDECEPDHQKFQTSKPMCPYIFEIVKKLLRDLMNPCVKPDLMKCRGAKLLSITVKKSENLTVCNEVDVGFAAKHFLAKVPTSVMDDPAENAKKEYCNLCNLKKRSFSSIMRGNEVYKHLWKIIKICLVLSHANSIVQGGFSTNKSFLVENMLEKTVVARHIQDEVQEAEGIEEIKINRRMLDYVRGARKCYHEYLDIEKQERRVETTKKAEMRLLDQKSESWNKKEEKAC
ncbi:hypothetical protein PR048_021384 [Dryococelus australis]|uniref:Uncharacterized protein n=1 Tax=Dryococelus australis TaxID=614101 RepID=A0ABQ9GY07_9NEOP|nr:hypothetical protein PR048_021384 [Dryococelus australis]